MENVQQNEHIKDKKIGKYVVGKDICEIVCINLDIRKEKREFMINEWKDYPFRFYTAQLHSNPKRGCTESHVSVIRYAKEKKYQNIMILEDDAKQAKDLASYPSFPEKWDMIYLGGLCVDIRKVYDNMWYSGLIYCNHAYIVNSSMYDDIIQKSENFQGAIDEFYASHMSSLYKCIMLKENYVNQKESYSDLDGKMKWKNYKWPDVGDMFVIP